jgi:Fur family transcriptional regulator, ferric uptake regulator
VTDGSREPARSGTAIAAGGWPDIRTALRNRGLRWTPQRQLILNVLGEASGHVTGAEIVERCRAREPGTTPSTVYRTLAVLEDLGYLHHSHGPAGREEFHVLSATEHAHLQCVACGGSWEVPPEETAGLVRQLESARGFRIDVGHLTIAGRCGACSAEG